MQFCDMFHNIFAISRLKLFIIAVKTSIPLETKYFERKIQSCISLKSERSRNLLKNMEGDTKIRTDPLIKKLDTPQFKRILSNELYTLMGLFNKYNYEIRIAGGAVRDLLMNIQPKDIDFATTATPDQMKEMFRSEKIRMINTKGEKHGTITPRINDKENFEITTLRIDVLTDGRHAEVEFTTSWKLDASRRDLTINSMFLGLDGSVYDYFYGLEDLMQKRVVFVGSADKRIKEDYLRILRYFRFYGRIAENSNSHNENILQAITQNAEGLQKISGERIWTELKKIIQGNFAFELILTMIQCNILRYIGLPKELNIVEFERIRKMANDCDEPLFPILYLVALLNNTDEVIKLHERLKLSAFERDLAIFISVNRGESKDLENLVVFQKMCLQPNTKKEFVEELLKYQGKFGLYKQLKEWKIPHFAINGNILKEIGCPHGNIMGQVMTLLKVKWAEGNFKTSKDDLLNIHYPTILQEVKNQNQCRKKVKGEIKS